MLPTDEPILIEPVAAPLSGRRSRFGRRRGLSIPLRAWVFGATLLALGGILAFVFFALPGRFEASRPPAGSPGSPDAASTSGGSPEDIVPPFRALELRQAQERAQQKLNEFVDMQLRLEQELNVATWGEDDMTHIKERASAGDRLFLEARYDEAMAEYAAAVAEIEALIGKGDDLFAAAVADGRAALDERDHSAATAAFERGLAIRPNDPSAQAGAARAAKLPEIVALLRESERAVLRDDYDRAHDLLARVRRLDAATAGLDARIAEAAAERMAKRRAMNLSEGFTALRDGDHAAALAAFDKALQDNPDDAAALAGRQQTEQSRILARIDRLREAALAAAQAEDWEAALDRYDEALAIDESLQFARDGKERVREWTTLVRTMNRVIADPDQLSSNREFAAAREVLERASAETDTGEKFAARLARFRDIVQRGAEPVPLVLLSDNATEVTIHKVGPIGAFARHELSLRPGRYVIVGSRDGCRDVRKEIVLSPGMAPVDIRCAERI